MNFNNDNEPWELQGDDYYLQKDSNFEISNSLWVEVDQNDESLSYMFDEATPIKACGDLAYHVTDSEKNMNQEQQEERRDSSSHLKRRRMLQYNTSNMDHSYCNEQISSAFEKPKDREDQIGAALPKTSDWALELTDRFASGNESLNQSPEWWPANCFNDTEMHFSSDNMNVCGASDEQIDVSEFCNFPPEVEANVVQGCSTPTPRSVFKGKKSFIQTPSKTSSAVAYPFALIKPCSVHGNVTLKDINQRIRTPPPSKSKQNDNDASASYPTSAFSGKPVVVKTKIRTEGGKGSITIMRTKG